MSSSCPRCGTAFPGRSIGTHARACGVTPEELFWHRVNKTSGCWLWTGSKRWDGYGRFNPTKDRQMTAHRYSWELLHGQLPSGMEVLHTCDTPACVRPNHLKIGTHHDNMIDCMEKRRHAHGERNIHAKLTEDQVRFVKANYRRGNGSEIARQLGISPTAIYAIGSGRSWRYVK